MAPFGLWLATNINMACCCQWHDLLLSVTWPVVVIYMTCCATILLLLIPYCSPVIPHSFPASLSNPHPTLTAHLETLLLKKLLQTNSLLPPRELMVLWPNHTTSLPRRPHFHFLSVKNWPILFTLCSNKIAIFTPMKVHQYYKTTKKNKEKEWRPSDEGPAQPHSCVAIEATGPDHHQLCHPSIV